MLGYIFHIFKSLISNIKRELILDTKVKFRVWVKIASLTDLNSGNYANIWKSIVTKFEKLSNLEVLKIYFPFLYIIEILKLSIF